MGDLLTVVLCLVGALKNLIPAIYEVSIVVHTVFCLLSFLSSHAEQFTKLDHTCLYLFDKQVLGT